MYGQGRKKVKDDFSGWLRRFTPIYRPTPAKGMAVDYPFKDVEDEILSAYKVSTKYGRKPTIRSKKEQAFQMGLMVAEPMEGEQEDFTEFEKTQEQKEKEAKEEKKRQEEGDVIRADVKAQSDADIKAAVAAANTAAATALAAAETKATADLATAVTAAQLQRAQDQADALAQLAQAQADAKNELTLAVTKVQADAAAESQRQVTAAIQAYIQSLGGPPPPGPPVPIPGPVAQTYPAVPDVQSLPSGWDTAFQNSVRAMASSDAKETARLEAKAMTLYTAQVGQDRKDEKTDIKDFETQLDAEVQTIIAARQPIPRRAKKYKAATRLTEIPPDWQSEVKTESKKMANAQEEAELEAAALQLYSAYVNQPITDPKQELDDFKKDLASEAATIVNKRPKPAAAVYPPARTLAALPAAWAQAVQSSLSSLAPQNLAESGRLRKKALEIYKTYEGRDRKDEIKHLQAFEAQLATEEQAIIAARGSGPQQTQKNPQWTGAANLTEPWKTAYAEATSKITDGKELQSLEKSAESSYRAYAGQDIKSDAELQRNVANWKNAIIVAAMMLPSATTPPPPPQQWPPFTNVSDLPAFLLAVYKKVLVDVKDEKLSDAEIGTLDRKVKRWYDNAVTKPFPTAKQQDRFAKSLQNTLEIAAQQTLGDRVATYDEFLTGEPKNHIHLLDVYNDVSDKFRKLNVPQSVIEQRAASIYDGAFYNNPIKDKDTDSKEFRRELETTLQTEVNPSSALGNYISPLRSRSGSSEQKALQDIKVDLLSDVDAKTVLTKDQYDDLDMTIEQKYEDLFVPNKPDPSDSKLFRTEIGKIIGFFMNKVQNAPSGNVSSPPRPPRNPAAKPPAAMTPSARAKLVSERVRKLTNAGRLQEANELRTAQAAFQVSSRTIGSVTYGTRYTTSNRTKVEKTRQDADATINRLLSSSSGLGKPKVFSMKAHLAKLRGRGKTHLETYYDKNVKATAGQGKRKRKPSKRAAPKKSRKKAKTTFDEDGEEEEAGVTSSRARNDDGIYFLVNKSY